MRFFLRILLITGFAVGLSGCDAISGLFPGGSDDTSVTENESTVGSAETDPAAPPATTDGSATDPASPDGTTPEGTDPNATDDGSVSVEEFGDPVVEGSDPVGNVPLDLIASTDPEERIRLVQRDRPDPFDILATTPTLEVPEDALTPPTPPTPPTVEPPQGEEGELAPIPELLPPPVPPAPPQPQTARAVTVTGVVQIGAVPYAIVDAPNEPHGRYVRSGQFLSNGQVLVKRIEMASGVIDPVVVLEEFGIEVSRQVGDPGVRPDPAGPNAPTGDVVYVEGESPLEVVAEPS